MPKETVSAVVEAQFFADRLLDEAIKRPSILPDDDSARARLDDPLTSHEAADATVDRMLVEAFVYELLALRPMTDWELTQAYFADEEAPQTDWDSPRKRRSDLTRKGEVVATEERRPGRTGRNQIVWQVAS